MYYYPILFILSTAGFFVSFHIYRSKKIGEKLVCFIGSGKKSCSEVVKSKYSKIFGIPNEAMGMMYYAGILLSTLVIPLSPELYVDALIFTVKVASVLAFFASMCLVGIQAFILKKFCEWCLATAAINALIFFIALFVF